MGIILYLLYFSEILLPSGVRIIKDESNLSTQISVGLEVNPLVSFRDKAEGLFIKRGYNYLYLRNADSLPILKQFVHLLTQDSLFDIMDSKNPDNLLRLTLLTFGGDISPVVNVTVGISAGVDENFITELFSLIPDSVISDVTNYYTLKPLQGKHIYYGDINFIANISPAPNDDEFLSFLVCLQIIQNRGFDIDFSPETAPSPFIINIFGENIESIFIKPEVEELKKGTGQLYRWIESELKESNKSKMIILSAMMGIKEDKFFNWMDNLEYLTLQQLWKVWKRYLIDGFISSGDLKSRDALIKLFPEAEVIK